MTPLFVSLQKSAATLDAGLLLLAGCIAAVSVLLVRLGTAPRRR